MYDTEMVTLHPQTLGNDNNNMHTDLWEVRGALMVSAVDSGLSPGQGHCVVFLGKKTLNSHIAKLSARSKCVPANCEGDLRKILGHYLRWTSIPSRGAVILLVTSCLAMESKPELSTRLISQWGSVVDRLILIYSVQMKSMLISCRGGKW